MIRSVAYIPSSEIEKMFPNCMSAFDASSVAGNHSFGDNEHSMLKLSEVFHGAWEELSSVAQQDLVAGKTNGDPFEEELLKFWRFMQSIGGDILVDLET